MAQIYYEDMNVGLRLSRELIDHGYYITSDRSPGHGHQKARVSDFVVVLHRPIPQPRRWYNFRLPPRLYDEIIALIDVSHQTSWILYHFEHPRLKELIQFVQTTFEDEIGMTINDLGDGIKLANYNGHFCGLSRSLDKLLGYC